MTGANIEMCDFPGVKNIEMCDIGGMINIEMCELAASHCIERHISQRRDPSEERGGALCYIERFSRLSRAI